MQPCEQNGVRRTATRRSFRVGLQRIAAAGAFAAVSLSCAHAADLPGPAGNPAHETIVVNGMSRDEVRQEVDKMVYAPWYRQVVRWDSSFCPLVSGLPERFRSFVVDRLNKAAESVIPGISKHCDTANVIVLFADNGTDAFNAIIARAPMLGSEQPPRGIGRHISIPPEIAAADLRKNLPVRWYRSNLRVPAPGAMDAFVPGIGEHNEQGVPEFESYSGGDWIKKTTQSETGSTIVIVDLPLASGSTWGQLADYISFVVLSGPRLGEIFDQNSIMSLFNDSHFQKTAPSRLTSFDRALLHALYAADPAQGANAEQGEIAYMVVDDLSLHRPTVR
ncbi:hypothetical protein HLH33_04395 [Gluconacetobacter diazotrophicus]|uniref:Sulfatase N-terminal domain-containing protein n=2 Tax=Gluconacetobacter diazotrophicus TaxID=33996 RepID=A0A7W4I3X7_GLUDI|nr:hypothetical protein [Gluconacetobacter diazotrophicus]MBB2155553.1 hypothetical protein [Gluconacetobacter diazotrophicus]